MVDVIPLGSALVAGIFSATLARQYIARRRPYQLIWTVSMALFAIGAFLEFVMSIVTVSGPLFDFYYIMVGPETGLLGAGVIYLLRPRIGKYIVYAVIALSACLVVSVFVWPVDISGNVLGQPGPVMTFQQWFQTSVVDGIYYSVGAFSAVPRDFTQILNDAGAIMVIGGGLLSFVLDRRRTYALLIVAGALMNAIGGILLAFYNYPDIFLYCEFLGIVLLFAGFYMSTKFISKAAGATQPPPAVPAPSIGK
ncbi:MAG: hypothetical protein ABSG45_05765 [Nitrososphaerales archaeon]